MPKLRTSKSTFGNDPFAALIPMPQEESPHELTTSVRGLTLAPADQELPPGPDPKEKPVAPKGPRRPSNADTSKPNVPAEDTARLGKQKLTVHLDAALADRVKNAAYWNPRLTIAGIAEQGIRHAIEKIERENGGRYKPREGELVGGRPIK